MKVAITGQRGYLGTCITNFFQNHGHEIFPLTRNQNFTLGDDLPDLRGEGVNAIIHAAYDFSETGRDEIYKINVDGSKKLLEQSKSQGINKIIFISSMSAFPDCQSNYGQAKLEIEKYANDFGAWILRPGLLFDKNPRGIVGTMKNIIKHVPIIPLVGDGKQELFFTHVEDLSSLCLEILNSDRTALKEPVIVANSKVWTFKAILDAFSKQLLKKRIFVPVPTTWVYFGLRVFETLGLNIGLRSDSIKSLVNYDRNVSFCILEKNFSTEMREFKIEP
jgi:nucleoside-diphosphate-sugar epimerase